MLLIKKLKLINTKLKKFWLLFIIYKNNCLILNL